MHSSYLFTELKTPKQTLPGIVTISVKIQIIFHELLNTFFLKHNKPMFRLSNIKNKSTSGFLAGRHHAGVQLNQLSLS